MKNLLLLLFLFLSFSIHGQMYYNNGRQLCCGDSLLVGSHRALGINPANLGRSGTFRKSLGLLQLGGSYYSDGLDLGGLLLLSFTDDSLSDNFKEDWLGQVSDGGPFIFSNNLEMEWLSFSIASERMGGMAFYLKDRVSSYSTIPGSMLALLLVGQDALLSQPPERFNAAGNGTTLFYSHIREASLGYGRKIYKREGLHLYAGFAVKRLWGIGYFRTNIDDGLVAGLSSFSHFYKINYGQLRLENNLDRKLLDTSGEGIAWDAGLAADIGQAFHVSFSVTDVGQLNWNEQVLRSRTSFGDFAGSLNEGVINSASFSEELEDVYQALDFQEGALFKTPLNTQFRLNTLYKADPRLSLSTDLILPVSENKPDILNYQPATFMAALNWNALPGYFNLSSGLFYSNAFGFRLPLGFSLGIFDNAMFSISTADLLTFVLNNRNPYAGLSITAFNYKF